LLVIVDIAVSVDTAFSDERSNVEQFTFPDIVDTAVKVEVVTVDNAFNIFVHAETPLELM